jgi:catechol 2,3-dioxygenase-like lactoylglutathione lyase family enzyme
MSLIKIKDVAHVRFRAPDLGEMQKFLEEFGLSVVHVDATHLFMRANGDAPFVHATEIGDAGFVALGLQADHRDDLDRLAEATGSEVVNLNTPGGGYGVRLHDPDGRLVEVVADQTRLTALPVRPRPAVNTGLDHPRQQQTVRVAAGPATVMRLGHIVLEVADFAASAAWYKEHFGLITSDQIEAAPGQPMGAFLRCDRGAQLTDHHSLFLLQALDKPRFNHAAFEVVDVNDIMCGHDHLKAHGREASWGIGRHILGSQIFDYWLDPWGHELEHWTDGDLFTATDGSNTATLQDLLAVQWGMPHPLVAAMSKEGS